jgi:hypothetical protein
MLTVLAQELGTTVAKRFGAHISAVGTSRLISDLRTNRAQLVSGNHQLPRQTAAMDVASAVPAVYEWQQERPGVGGINRVASTLLSFYDSSGEDLSDAERTRDQHYLAAADGLILILDPFGFEENHERALARGVNPEHLKNSPHDVLQNVTEMLRAAEQIHGSRKIKRPLAVVLAKIDAFYATVEDDDPIRKPSSVEPCFDEAESLDLHYHVESLVSQWGGDSVLSQLRMNYSSYRFFVASALGAEPDYRSGFVDARGVSPHRVVEPLLWLLAGRGFIETRR